MHNFFPNIAACEEISIRLKVVDYSFQDLVLSFLPEKTIFKEEKEEFDTKEIFRQIRENNKRLMVNATSHEHLMSAPAYSAPNYYAQENNNSKEIFRQARREDKGSMMNDTPPPAQPMSIPAYSAPTYYAQEYNNSEEISRQSLKEDRRNMMQDTPPAQPMSTLAYSAPNYYAQENNNPAVYPVVSAQPYAYYAAPSYSQYPVLYAVPYLIPVPFYSTYLTPLVYYPSVSVSPYYPMPTYTNNQSHSTPNPNRLFSVTPEKDHDVSPGYPDRYSY